VFDVDGVRRVKSLGKTGNEKAARQLRRLFLKGE
jgi:hypothetical protein